MNASALSVKTVPQWVRKWASITRQLCHRCHLAKTARVGTFYFFTVGWLLASPAAFCVVPPGNALQFNGSNTYVQMNEVNLGTSDFTIEGWIKPNSVGGYIYTNRTGESGGSGNWFGFGLSGNKLTLELASCASSYLPIQGNSTLSSNVWYHVAIVRSPTTITLYVNGVQEGQVSDSSSLRNLTTGNNITRFGGWPDYNGGWYNGQVDEFRVWNVARTQTQIQSNMHRTLVGNEANLVAYYDFDQTSGTTLPDVTGHGHDGALVNGPSWTAATWKYGYPYVTTGTVSALTATTVAVGGTVVDAGISTVTASGICYATSASPTTPCTTDGPTGAGAIPGSLTNLTPQGVTYYTRAYATNSVGTIYSYASDVTFTTRYLPVIAQGTSVSVTMAEDGSPTAWSTPTITATNTENDTMTWTLVTPATHGTATVAGTGASPTITYSPTADYNGTDSFVAQVADVDGVATITVNVTVNPVNDPPTFTASNPPAVLENTGTHTVTTWATFNPGSNETDSVLAYIVNNITNPNLFSSPPSVTTNGTLTYTLATNQSGSSNFKVTVRDNGGTANGGVDLSTTATFTVSVSAPEINVKQGATNIPSGGSFDVGPSAVGHQVTYPFTIENLGNSNLTLNGTPKIRVSGNNAGEFSVDEMTTTSPLVGGSTTFLLTFLPNSLGTKTATLSMANNDGDEGNYTMTVMGTAVPSKNLQITLAGTGQGTVTSDLPGLDCAATPSSCSLPVIDSPRWVTLTPVPTTGSEFIGWTGDAACQTDGQVLIVQDTSCTAEFTLKNYQLTANFLGKGRVTGPGIDCPGQCTATYLYGTTVTLTAQATRKMWEFSGWRGCDSQGNITITNDVLCQAVFTPDPNIPNAGDGNGDGLPDAYQDNVVSLPDKVSGTYLTLEAQPATCIISDIYPDLPETQTIKLDHTKKFPQGMLYFDIACPQAQVSVYYHGMSKVYRNLKFYKFGPKIPGDLTTIAWYQLPNIKYEVVMVGEKPVVKGTYTLTDGELGDSTGVDGHLVDPGGVVYP